MDTIVVEIYIGHVKSFNTSQRWESLLPHYGALREPCENTYWCYLSSDCYCVDHVRGEDMAEGETGLEDQLGGLQHDDWGGKLPTDTDFTAHGH